MVAVALFATLTYSGSGPALEGGPARVQADVIGGYVSREGAERDYGVVLAGDRRATAGSMIAKRDVEKVFRSDEFSAIGYAGTGSVGIEFVRLFQVELEHYEKLEGMALSFEGKANRLSTMIRGNLGMAMQGLAVVPMFAGWDADDAKGRISSYDVTGGTMKLTGDGKFSAVTSTRQTLPGSVDNFVDSIGGTWTQSGNSVQMTLNDGTSAASTRGSPVAVRGAPARRSSL